MNDLEGCFFVLNILKGDNNMKKIIVLKIGTKSLITKKGRFRRKLMESIARDILAVQEKDWKVVIVSSGAVGFGKKNCSQEVFDKISLIANEAERNQCFAMLGQDRLINAWRNAFRKEKLDVGQLLYVNDMLKKKSKCRVIKGLENLLESGVVPIINENDAVTIEEIENLEGFGDNDYLGALVSIALEAKYYVNLSTVPCVYCPISGKKLEHIDAQENTIQKHLKILAGDSNGGMPSKLKNAKLAALVGIHAIIAKNNESNILQRIIAGEEVGTLISISV